MLRINLLPAYIAERRKVKTALFGAGALYLAILGLLLFYQFGIMQKKVADREQEANDMQTKADAESAYEAATAQLLTKVKPLADKVSFVENVRYHNKIRQKIYRQAAAYTYKEIEYNGMSVTAQTLAVSGLAKSVSDIGRFYITMFGNPDVTAVSITGVPGYPQTQPPTQQIGPDGIPISAPPRIPTYPVTLTATLVRPVIAPVAPDAGGAAGTAGAPAAAPAAGVPTDAPPPPDAPPPGA